MKRFAFAGLSVLALNFVLVPASFASEAVSRESNLSGQNITIPAPRDLASTDAAAKNGAMPPSGDSNPSDRSNPTVDSRDIINPQAKAGKPPSGDSNPSDRFHPTVDGRDVINSQAN